MLCRLFSFVATDIAVRFDLLLLQERGCYLLLHEHLLSGVNCLLFIKCLLLHEHLHLMVEVRAGLGVHLLLSLLYLRCVRLLISNIVVLRGHDEQEQVSVVIR